ncbi:hypothetical protein [Pilimelia columellifera]|uniref:Secreted protein n=1 Tax=Pilimelia columellifera subsp. columellifera TaxID=706583 RepID=A0ABN3MX09_9ACTN
MRNIIVGAGGALSLVVAATLVGCTAESKPNVTPTATASATSSDAGTPQASEILKQSLPGEADPVKGAGPMAGAVGNTIGPQTKAGSVSVLFVCTGGTAYTITLKRNGDKIPDSVEQRKCDNSMYRKSVPYRAGDTLGFGVDAQAPQLGTYAYGYVDSSE